MIEQSSRRGNKQIDALSQLVGLRTLICTAHDDTARLRMVLHQVTGNAEKLECQLASGADDDDTGAVPRLES